jgi:hypothetical protein
MYHHAFFGRFANVAARAMGYPLAFVLAVLIIVGCSTQPPRKCRPPVCSIWPARCGGVGERPPWSSLIRPETPSGPLRWPPSREKPAHDPPCGHRDGNPQCGGGLELDGEILWPSGSRSPSALMSVLAVQYAQNWDAHRQHSQPYVGREVR